MEIQTDPKIEELRAEIQRLGADGLSPEMRAAAVAYYRRRSEQGATQAVAAGELGLNRWTLAKWWQKRLMEPERAAGPEVDAEGDLLRDEIANVGPRSPSRRYPEELRGRIISWVRSQRAQGARGREVSARLGIPWESLSRWTGERAPARKSKLRAVAIVADRVGTAGLVLRGGQGFWVEGLDVAALAELLRKLG